MASNVNRMQSLPELEVEIVNTTGEIATLKRRKIDQEAQIEKKYHNVQLLLHSAEELKMDLEKKPKMKTDALESEVAADAVVLVQL